MIYVFFPIAAAMFYGMAFALMERALQATNVVTYMVMSALVTLPLITILALIKKEAVSFDFLSSKASLAIVIAAVIAPAFGWFLTAYAIKNTNAAYAAFAEVSYPLFTILFLFLFFGIKHFDWHLFTGGLLVIAGSFILILGQLSKGA